MRVCVCISLSTSKLSFVHIKLQVLKNRKKQKDPVTERCRAEQNNTLSSRDKREDGHVFSFHTLADRASSPTGTHSSRRAAVYSPEISSPRAAVYSPEKYCEKISGNSASHSGDAGDFHSSVSASPRNTQGQVKTHSLSSRHKPIGSARTNNHNSSPQASASSAQSVLEAPYSSINHSLRLTGCSQDRVLYSVCSDTESEGESEARDRTIPRIPSTYNEEARRDGGGCSSVSGSGSGSGSGSSSITNRSTEAAVSKYASPLRSATVSSYASPMRSATVSSYASPMRSATVSSVRSDEDVLTMIDRYIKVSA